MPHGNEGDGAAFLAVFDTNVLIDVMRDALGAPARLLDAVREGMVIPIATDAVRKEYALIIQRMRPAGEDLEHIKQFVQALKVVAPQDTDVVIDDKEDYKFIQAALGGNADYIITSDRHLLDVGEVGATRIVSPTEAMATIEGEGTISGAWQSWVKGLGIG